MAESERAALSSEKWQISDANAASTELSTGEEYWREGGMGRGDLARNRTGYFRLFTGKQESIGT